MMKFSSGVVGKVKSVSNNIKFGNTSISSEKSRPPGGSGGVSSRDFTELSENLSILRDVILVRTTKALALGLVQILAAAQPRVPWDTGKLRESGNARIMLGGRRGIVVARGTKSGTVNVMMDKINSKRTKNVKRIDAVIEYKRDSDEGDVDVALWTHEDLNPYGGDSPAAKKPGTGPKYLEIAWNETKGSVISLLQEAVSSTGIADSINRVTKNIRKKKGRYTVDQRILSKDRIDSLGYFG